MALITWDSNQYSVGIRSIDTDHIKIVNFINDLHEKMKEGKGTSVILEILEEMLSYTDYHFKREETYFETYAYPEAEIHKAEHKKFIEQVNTLIEKYKKRDIRISLDTMSFLKDWLFTHILQSDKKYSEFLNSKGVC